MSWAWAWPYHGPHQGTELGWGFGVRLPVLAAWPQPFAGLKQGCGVGTAPESQGSLVCIWRTF